MGYNGENRTEFHWLISDEIYNEFIWSGRHISIAAETNTRSRTAIISSFSKTFAMTGWRLGYIITNSELTNIMLGLQGNMVLCPAGFVQRAGVAALDGTFEPVQKMADEYERRVDFISKRLNEIDGITCQKPEGAFYVWPDISDLKLSSKDFCNELIDKEKVVTIAGSHFGTAGEGYIRLALVNPLNILTEALDRIENYVKKL
jgi:aminotransferase